MEYIFQYPPAFVNPPLTSYSAACFALRER